MAVVGKVLIVGGGIAGMSCAIQLRNAGIAVDLVEIDPQWRIYGAGITLTGPTLRALRTVGVLPEVVAAGATWSGAKVHDKSGTLLEEAVFPPLAADLPGTGGIMRPELHRILSCKTLSSGTRVRLGVSVTHLDQGDSTVRVTLTDGSCGSYDLVVGADGIFSAVRGILFPDSPKPTFTGQVIYRLVAEQPHGFDRSHFFMGDEVKLGFNPVSSTHMYMFLLHAEPGNRWIDPKDQPTRLYQALAGFGGFVPQIRETVLGVNAATVNYRPLEVLLQPAPWHRGHVVLIGDAVHATTPHLASGAGMAVEDGIVLADELTSQPMLAGALENFMRRRFARCQLIIENSVKLGQIEMTHGSPALHTALMKEALTTLRQPI